MTGQGEARVAFSGGGFLVAEVRSVNNRHLKVSSRLSDGLSFMEPVLESLVRAKVKRGSIQLNVTWQGRPDVEVQQIRSDVLRLYIDQLRQVSQQLDFSSEIRWTDLLNLPGVIGEASAGDVRSPELAEGIKEAVERALDELTDMRAREGSSMAIELRRQLDQLCQIVQQIDARAPEVVAEYRLRLKQRVVAAIAEAVETGSTVSGATVSGATVSGATVSGATEPGSTNSGSAESGAKQSGAKQFGARGFGSRGFDSVESIVQDSDLIREVAIMSDKTDIREEIVRLRSHFVQFEELLRSTESQGRRLDFLIQEMFREANTIGSKASDALISQSVVELKAVMEQIRELVQNVE